MDAATPPPHEPRAVPGVDGDQPGRLVQTATVYGDIHVHGDGPDAIPLWRMPVPRQLPPADGVFVDRATELARLREVMPRKGAAPVPVLISGVYGIGKTTLAGRALAAETDRFPDGVLYADLRGVGRPAGRSLTEVVAGFLCALGVAADDVPADREAVLALYRSVTATRRLAVLATNATTAHDAETLFPAGPGSLLLLTTPYLAGDLHTWGGARLRRLELGPLAPGPAWELLRTLTGDDARLEADPACAAALIDATGGHARSLTVLAQHLVTHPRLSLSALASDITSVAENRSRMPLWKEQLVPSILDTAYAALGPAAARAFRLLALHTGPWLTVEAAAALLDHTPAETQSLLDGLVAAGLLTLHGGGRYGFDGLTQHYALDYARQPGVNDHEQAARLRLATYYLHTLTAADAVVSAHRPHLSPAYEQLTDWRPFTGRAHALAWIESEVDNLRAIIHSCHTMCWWPLCWQLVEAMWGYLLDRRPLELWRRIHEWGLPAAEHDGSSRATARMHLQTGYLDLITDDPFPAYLHFIAALHLAIDAANTTLEASAREHLALAMLQRGRGVAALAHIGDAIRLTDPVTEPRAMAVYQRRLGETRLAMGMPHSAVPALERAEQISVRLGDFVQCARVRTRLGQAHTDTGNPARGAEILRHAITDLATARATTDHADALEHLAHALRDSDPEEAREHLVAAFALYHDLHDGHGLRRTHAALENLGSAPNPGQP
ncbi:hypothetical protein [Amycolatopsis sp. NPDC059021]|uniref:hypothetical protein n=1 Tax=Amycolatopsis sp. NPDC059021 TaxID=3346704 RepID=UPI00366A5634